MWQQYVVYLCLRVCNIDLCTKQYYSGLLQIEWNYIIIAALTIIMCKSRWSYFIRNSSSNSSNINKCEKLSCSSSVYIFYEICETILWVSTGYPFKSLMSEGKKEFLKMEVLRFTLLYLRPEGRSVNGPCCGWVGSLRMEAALLWTLRW